MASRDSGGGDPQAGAVVQPFVRPNHPRLTLVSMRVAVSRFASGCEATNLVRPPTDPPSPTQAEALQARLMGEIRGRDEYIESLHARNHLLRIQLEELKREMTRLQRGSRPAPANADEDRGATTRKTVAAGDQRRARPTTGR